MLSLLHPFEKDTLQINQIPYGARPELDPSWRAEFIEIIQLCWSTEPEKRPSAKELLKMFDALSGNETPTTPSSEIITFGVGDLVQLMDHEDVVGVGIVSECVGHTSLCNVIVFLSPKLKKGSKYSWKQQNMKLLPPNSILL